MMGSRTVSRRAQGDEGAALILALAFVVGVGLVAGAVLGYAGTVLTSARPMAQRAQSDYDVDGALQAAVNGVRASSYDNGTGETCLNSGSLDVPGSNGTVRVVCSAAAGTGAAAGLVPITGANRPGSAVLTLGTNAGEPGLGLGSNGTLLVKGRVVSNSTISAGGAASVLSSPYSAVKAKGACTATVNSNPAPQCNYTPTSDAGDFADPGYAPPPTAVSDLNYRTVPACSGSVITLLPGYYDDAAALNALTNGGSCSGRTLWFKPGQYYFDFRNADHVAGLSQVENVWTVDDAAVKIVAGTPDGWTTSPYTAPTIPGSCVSPLTTVSNGGVQWAFGGDSRFVVTSGQAEICGQYSSSKPALAVFGVKSGSESTATVTAGPTGSTSPVPTVGAVAFAPVAAIQAQDDAPATAVLDSTGASGDTVAAVQVNGFATGTIPAGSVLQSAQLEVRHRETVTSGALKEIRVSGTVGGVAVPSTVLTPSAAWRTDVVPLTDATANSLLAQGLHSGAATASALVVQASVDRKRGSTQNQASAALDSVQLRLTYKPPSVRGETTTLPSGSNCIGTAPYVPLTGGSNCALITTSGAQSRLYIQGTLYAPRAALDIQLTNVSAEVFRAGLIVRSLRIKVTPSATYTGPVIEVPDDSPGYTSAPLAMFFVAYVCPPSQVCSAAPPNAPWRAVGQARATYTDASVTPTPGRRQVAVTSWNVPR